MAVVLTIPGGAYAHAHSRLLDPTPRDPNDTNKDETQPCGVNEPRTANPSVFAPGQQITVKWEETVEHPGHYELAIAMDDNMNFQNIAGQANIADQPGATAATPNLYQAQITLPNTECARCTLRMVQVMGDDQNTEYRSCADLVITAAAVDGDGGPLGDGGTIGTDGGPTHSGGIGDAPGLCSVAWSHATSPWSALWLGAVVAGLAIRRRRRD